MWWSGWLVIMGKGGPRKHMHHMLMLILTGHILKVSIISAWISVQVCCY